MLLPALSSHITGTCLVQLQDNVDVSIQRIAYYPFAYVQEGDISTVHKYAAYSLAVEDENEVPLPEWFQWSFVDHRETIQVLLTIPPPQCLGGFTSHFLVTTIVLTCNLCLLSADEHPGCIYICDPGKCKLWRQQPVGGSLRLWY